MGNPLLLITHGSRERSSARQRLPGDLRRLRVPIPVHLPPVEAVFVMLRRLRAPLITLVVIVAVAVAGLALIPGQDGQGNPTRMSVFDAFYVISYTATTIGFGEIPYPFTTGQRMWVTASIYASVVGWAFVLGTLLRAAHDDSLRQVVRTQAVARRVRRLREPFVLIAGYGQAGRLVAQGLDAGGRRVVVIDRDPARTQAVEVSTSRQEVIAVCGDAADPAVLGLAGLGHPRCEAVLPLTDDDQANLAVVMTVQMLRPSLPVVARCGDRRLAQRMQHFAVETVINPFDRFGAYLVLAVQHPVVFRLIGWLLSSLGTALPPQRTGLSAGRWVVCADGQFGTEMTADLQSAGLDAHLLPSTGGQLPDLDDAHLPLVQQAVGFIAGTDNDLANLAVAAKARLANPQLFVGVRQQTHRLTSLLEAFDPDAVFVPTELVAREALARVITPRFWGFIDYAMNGDDRWAQPVLDAIVATCGQNSPATTRVRLTLRQAPAVVRWLRAGRPFTVQDLLRHPDQRDQQVSALAVVLQRRDQPPSYLPSPDTAVHEGDELVLLTCGTAEDVVESVLFYDTAVEYVVTGTVAHATWLLRAVANQRRRQRGPSGHAG